MLRSRVSLNLFVGVLCALSLLAPGVSRSANLPGVHVQKRFEYYEVPGATYAELKAALDARKARGVDWTGRTATSIVWSVPVNGRGDCRLTDASVNLTLTVILPRLPAGVRLSAGEAERWRRAENTLADHEDGHVQIATDGAQRILRTIQASRCTDWKGAAEGEATALQARQKAYDLRTDHGRQNTTETVDQAAPANNLNGYPVQWSVQDAE